MHQARKAFQPSRKTPPMELPPIKPEGAGFDHWKMRAQRGGQTMPQPIRTVQRMNQTHEPQKPQNLAACLAVFREGSFWQGIGWAME
jgi:hypothetical protein